MINCFGVVGVWPGVKMERQDLGSRKRFMKNASIIAPILDPGGLFKGYDLHKVAQLSTSIEEMDAVTLNYWLSKFVMEVTKKSGERYPPKTVYGIVCGIRRCQR